MARGGGFLSGLAELFKSARGEVTGRAAAPSRDDGQAAQQTEHAARGQAQEARAQLEPNRPEPQSQHRVMMAGLGTDTPAPRQERASILDRGSDQFRAAAEEIVNAPDEDRKRDRGRGL